MLRVGSDRVYKLLGGKEYLKNVIHADNFKIGQVFPFDYNEEYICSFSFEGCRSMNYVCIAEGYRIDIFKITLLKHRLIKSEQCNFKNLRDIFIQMTGLKI